MIEIGIIAHGRRLMERPIGNAIHALLLELRQADERPIIELVYVIPGELGKADFEGFQLSRRRDGNRRPLVFIDVPADVAEADPREPLGAVIDLARAALEFARSSLGGRPNAPDFDGAAQRLERARDALLGTGIDGWLATKVESRPVLSNSGREPQPDTDAGVEVILSVNDQAAIDRAFQLEDALEIALVDAKTGYVDGNEIGQSTFRIFTYGPSLPALREAVIKLVSSHWSSANAEIRSIDPDVEVDRQTP